MRELLANLLKSTEGMDDPAAYAELKAGMKRIHSEANQREWDAKEAERAAESDKLQEKRNADRAKFKDVGNISVVVGDRVFWTEVKEDTGAEAQFTYSIGSTDGIDPPTRKVHRDDFQVMLVMAMRAEAEEIGRSTVRREPYSTHPPTF